MSQEQQDGPSAFISSAETCLRLATGKENQRQNEDQKESNNQLIAQSRTSDKVCFECHRPLAKSRHLIHITGHAHRWHPECFRCHLCQVSMAGETSCHLFKEQIVCKDDYARLQRDYSPKCARCRWPIGASDWVRRAGQYVYHLACFSCDMCQRQLSTGEQFMIHEQHQPLSLPLPSGQTDLTQAPKLLCRLHFIIQTEQQSAVGGTLAEHQVSAGIAPASPSTQSSIQAQSKEIQQLRQQQPQMSLDMQPPGQQSLPSQTPQTQSAELPWSALPSPDRTGTSSPKAYTPESYLNNAKFQALNQPEQQQQSQHYLHYLGNSSSGAQQQMMQARAGGSNQASSSMAQQEELSLSQEQSQMNGNSVGDNQLGLVAPNSSHSGASKSKRVRTTFTEDQLAILQTHFQIDSNPDGQDLERIATITGLSKRVTQVWFQNSRARQKKCIIKRKPSSAAAAAAVAAVAASGIGSGLRHFSGPNSSEPTGRHQDGSDLAGQRQTVQAANHLAWSNRPSLSEEQSSELSMDATETRLDELDDSQQFDSDDQLLISDASNQS